MPGPPRISVAELAAGAADFPLLDDTGRLSGPLLAVELPDGLDAEHFRAVLRRAAVRAADCPRLLVGLASGPLPDCTGDLLRALDLTFTPEGGPGGTPERAATFTSEGAATFTPESAATFTSEGAATFTPQSAATFTPEGAATFTPERAATFTPESAATFTSEGAATFTPESAATFTPEGAATFTPERAATFTSEGAASSAPGRVAVPDPAAALEALAAAVAARPQAALVLRQVLRATGELPVREALDTESLAYSALLGGPEFADWLAGRGPRPAPPEVADPVLVRRDSGDDGRLLITLNRPERRNAYGRQLRDALADALRVALLDPSVTRVVIDGAGPCFSSGGDLGEFGTAPDPVTAHFVRTQAGAALLLHAVRDRAEVRVHGSCVGAGVELPAFAASVTAAAGTTFALPEVGMGLIPGAGGTVSIPRRIGRWRTLYLALSGCRLDAGTALAWGLVDRIEDAGRLDPAGPLDPGGPQPPGALA